VVQDQCTQPQLVPHPPPETGGSPSLLLSFDVSTAATSVNLAADSLKVILLENRAGFAELA
jgi:hypothetical protein